MRYGSNPGFQKITELQPLLKPYPADAMRRYPVSRRVNQVKNDDAECAAEIDPSVLNRTESTTCSSDLKNQNSNSAFASHPAGKPQVTPSSNL